MEQRLSIITLGAENLQAMRHFYVNIFNWKPIAENKDIIFFKLNGMLLGLYSRPDMAKFNHASPEGSGFRPYNLAHMVSSKEKVDELYQNLKDKGVTIIHEPKTDPLIGGWFFLFKDIEGNVWEVAYNLFITLDNEGNVITHLPIDHL